MAICPDHLQHLHRQNHHYERVGGYGRILKTNGIKHQSSEVFTIQNDIQTSKVKSLVAEIEDPVQGSQDDALRRGWGKKFSFVKLLDGEDIFQKSASPSKRRKISSNRQPQTERSPTTPSPSCTASRSTSTMPTPPPATGDTLVGGESSLTDTIPDSESEFLGVKGRLPVSSVMVHQPPALGPTILPFWNGTPGVSAAPPSSSPSRGTATPSCSSKRKRIRKLEKQSSSLRNTVKEKILLIEASKERKEEDKITFALSLETDRKTEDKIPDEENEEKDKGYHHLQLGISVRETMNAYLQGLGPQTGPGSAPASSSSESSLGSGRRGSSSEVGSAKGRGLQAWQVQE